MSERQQLSEISELLVRLNVRAEQSCKKLSNIGGRANVRGK